MNGYIQLFIGIFVSLVLFWITYRKTYGARQEKAKNCNFAIVNILLSRLVKEDGLTVDKINIERLIESKAIESRIKISSLLNKEQFLTIVYGKIVENQFINEERRKNVISMLDEMFTRIEKEGVNEELVLVTSEMTEKRIKYQRFNLMAIAMITSIIGASFAILPKLINSAGSFYSLMSSGGELLIVLLTIIVSSFSVVLWLYARSKNMNDIEGENTDKISIHSMGLEFERRVLTFLEQNKIAFTPAILGEDSGYDLVVEKGGRKIFVEIKAWENIPPLNILNRTIAKFARNSHQPDENSEFIIIMKEGIKEPLLYNSSVKVMDLKQFRNYIVHLS